MEGSEAQDDAWLVLLGLVVRVGWLLGMFTVPITFSTGLTTIFHLAQHLDLLTYTVQTHSHPIQT